ncbi:cation:proton antiporter [Desnuesiella massiliensis]|uniref:cation:proton antiporter domain-containing protein n=1 Tax=Desnuesiella massiliensis TaxID=1650662 RepID=UPI0006E2677B|nr:cation:proton antiporter [Desnuesiella massiliensis]
MITSLGIIMILGLIANYISKKLSLPGLIGMLLLGILLGPYGLNWIQQDLINISADIRKLALIIILLRAGLGIKKEDLAKVGVPAIKLSCIPGVIEGIFIAIASVYLLNFSFVQGGILGFIMAAVSPAVIVPSMLHFMERGLGTKKGIPTLILAGASIDDVFAITIFSAFLGLYSGTHVNLGVKIIGVPISILLGIALGVVSGLILIRVFKKYHIRDTEKVLIIIGISILLSALENVLKNKIEIAALLGVMTIGFIIIEKLPKVGERLAIKFNKIWVFAEILLFVLVGAQVNINVAINAGTIGIIILLIGLVGRGIGVILSLAGTDLNFKERLFCVIAYIPKATVQAAIGSVPLSLGVASGDVMLAIAVLSIIITAPIGAYMIGRVGDKLLI